MASSDLTPQPLSKRMQFLVVCWLAASMGLVTVMWCYELRAGDPASIRTEVPDAFGAASATHGQLFVFVHPMCGCTAATLEELERLLNDLPESRRPTTRVVVLQPESQSEHWESRQAEQLCTRLDQADLLHDEGGRIAKEFGATTSGQVILYGADGSLLFDGGITVARGHRGPSAGQDLLRKSLETGEKSAHRIPVFGCALMTQE